MSNYWGNQGGGSPWLPPASSSPTPSPSPRRDDPRYDVSERSARLLVTLAVCSVAVLIVGLVVFFTVKTIRQHDRGSDNPALAAPKTTTPEDAERVVGGIGPPPGIDVVTYVNQRKAALAAATGDRIAVVSFNAYTSDTKAKAAVDGTEVVALLAAAPGGQPAVVTGDLTAWVTAQTADARSERDEIQRLIPTAGNDPQFQSFYKSEVDRLNKLIASIKPDGVVFAIVVKGPAATLQQLASKPDIRLVDVGLSADPGDKPDYRGLRPEESSKANDPNTRPTS